MSVKELLACLVPAFEPLHGSVALALRRMSYCAVVDFSPAAAACMPCGMTYGIVLMRADGVG